MEKRMINNQEVSLLGMGCMRLPVTEDNQIDYVKTEQMIDYAYENGIISDLDDDDEYFKVEKIFDL